MAKKVYYPILKGKQGEFDAIAAVSRDTKQRITPLIDVPRKSSEAKGLMKIADNLRRSWGSEDNIIIDLYHISPSKIIEGNEHVLNYLFNCLSNCSVRAVPTTGLDRGEQYIKAALGEVSKRNNGVCIRLLEDDLVDIDNLNIEIEKLLRTLKVDKEEVYLMIDLRAVYFTNALSKATIVINAINGIRNISSYKSLIFASSGFPNILNGTAGSISKVKRIDYELWQAIIQASKGLIRKPTYSDYGIVHPDKLDEYKKFVSPAAKIRYTTESEWIVLRGKQISKHGTAQYQDLSKRLCEMPSFIGSWFSRGDDYIDKCAKRMVSGSTPQKWITNDTNHHITFVVKQVSNYPAP